MYPPGANGDFFKNVFLKDKIIKETLLDEGYNERFFKEDFCLCKVSIVINFLACYCLHSLKNVPEELLFYKDIHQYGLSKELLKVNPLNIFSYHPLMINHPFYNKDRFNISYQQDNFNKIENALFKDGKIYGLYGEYGVGKSELVNYYITSKIEESKKKKTDEIRIGKACFKYILKVNCSSLKDNNDEVIIEALTNINLDYKSSNIKNKANELLEFLKKKEYAENVLLIIDNYKNFSFYVDELEKKDAFFDKLCKTGAGILLIANVDLEGVNNKLIPIKMNRLSNDNLFNLYKEIIGYDVKFSDIEINKIKQLIENRLFDNTYSVVLVAKIVESLSRTHFGSFNTLKDKTKYVNSLHNEAIRVFDLLSFNDNQINKTKIQDNANIYDLFKRIVSLFKTQLDEKEIEVLLDVAYIPDNGLEYSLLIKMFNCDEKTLTKLANFRLITINEQNNISIHQIIKTVVLDMASGTKNTLFKNDKYKDLYKFYVGMPSSLKISKNIIDNTKDITDFNNLSTYYGVYVKENNDKKIFDIDGKAIIIYDTNNRELCNASSLETINKLKQDLSNKTIKKYSTTIKQDKYTSYFDITPKDND